MRPTAVGAKRWASSGIRPLGAPGQANASVPGRASRGRRPQRAKRLDARAAEQPEIADADHLDADVEPVPRVVEGANRSRRDDSGAAAGVEDATDQLAVARGLPGRLQRTARREREVARADQDDVDARHGEDLADVLHTF